MRSNKSGRCWHPGCCLYKCVCMWWGHHIQVQIQMHIEIIYWQIVLNTLHICDSFAALKNAHKIKHKQLQLHQLWVHQYQYVWWWYDQCCAISFFRTDWIGIYIYLSDVSYSQLWWWYQNYSWALVYKNICLCLRTPKLYPFTNIHLITITIFGLYSNGSVEHVFAVNRNIGS